MKIKKNLKINVCQREGLALSSRWTTAVMMTADFYRLTKWEKQKHRI
jgi:hypothetical protein